jgi:hypothetical protein
MKKILLITLLTIFAISYSQAQTFAPEGAEWTFCTIAGPGDRFKSFAESDSSYFLDDKLLNVINGKVESKKFNFHLYTNDSQTYIYTPEEDIFTLMN